MGNGDNNTDTKNMNRRKEDRLSYRITDHIWKSIVTALAVIAGLIAFGRNFYASTGDVAEVKADVRVLTTNVANIDEDVAEIKTDIKDIRKVVLRGQ